jgi:hypothetical protein
MSTNLFKTGLICEAKDFNSKWMKAKIIEIDNVNNRAKIHYIDQDARFDEWVMLTEDNIKICDEKEQNSDLYDSNPN